MERATDGVLQSTSTQSGRMRGAGCDFVTVKQGRCRLSVRSGFEGTDLQRVLPEGEAGLRRRFVLERIQSASSSRVFRFSVRFQDTDKTVYFKDYIDRSIWDVLKHMVRPSRARRAFVASTILTAYGFNAPEVLAVGETRKTPWTKGCFLLTFAVMESLPVYILLSKDSSELDTDALHQKRDLIRTLGHTIGRMHKQGIVHGDLRPGNILARYQEGRWQLFFLDNERTRRFPWVPAHLRRKNLVQVGMVAAGVGRTDHVRFWQAYLTECPDLRLQQKRWARRVYARTVERLKKY